MPAAGAIPVIVNVTSGTGWDESRREAIAAAFRRAGAEARIIAVEDGREAHDRAVEALKHHPPVLVAGGGDGTLSAVAAVVHHTPTALGILPLGTLNHFARDLGIPDSLEEAARIAVSGRRQPVDLGEVNGRIFLNNSSLGIYPDIVRDRVRQQRRLGRGKRWALFWATFTVLRRSPFLHTHVTMRDERREYRAPFLFVGNNEYVMEGFDVGRRTSLRKGCLSLYITQRRGRLGLLALGFRALLGRLKQAHDFEMATAEAINVETRHRYVRVAADGEVYVMQAPLRYRIRPDALVVMAP